MLREERAREAVRNVGRRRGTRCTRHARVLLVLVVLVPVSIVWVYPFIWTISSSIKSNAEILGSLNPFPRVIEAGNYIRAWNEARVGRYFVNTVIVTVGSIILSVATTAMLGYVLGRYSFAGKKFVIGVFAAAVFLPEGYTIIPVFNLITVLHLQGSLWGLILGLSGGVHVVMILLFAGYFRQLPGDLEEASRVDGAGFLRIFLQVYLPLAKPVVATAVILQFMSSWNAFLLPLVLTLSRPELRTLAVGIYFFQGVYETDWSGMMAAAVLAIVPMLLVFVLLQRYFVESVAGAMKG